MLIHSSLARYLSTYSNKTVNTLDKRDIAKLYVLVCIAWMMSYFLKGIYISR